jgi:YD repeat-containing protein
MPIKENEASSRVVRCTAKLLAYDSMTSSSSIQVISSAAPAGTTDYAPTLYGGLASVTPPGGPAQDYTWDAYGDLASAGGSGYGYDALGRPVSSTSTAGTAQLSYLGTGATLACRRPEPVHVHAVRNGDGDRTAGRPGLHDAERSARGSGGDFKPGVHG